MLLKLFSLFFKQFVSISLTCLLPSLELLAPSVSMSVCSAAFSQAICSFPLSISVTLVASQLLLVSHVSSINSLPYDLPILLPSVALWISVIRPPFVHFLPRCLLLFCFSSCLLFFCFSFVAYLAPFLEPFLAVSFSFAFLAFLCHYFSLAFLCHHFLYFPYIPPTMLLYIQFIFCFFLSSLL